MKQVQACILWRRPLYRYQAIHPCDPNKELFTVVDEDGEVSSGGQPPQDFTPEFLTKCK
jgi:hypothetical protein